MEVVSSGAAEGGRENWATCTFVGARAARCAIALRRAPRSLRTSLAQVLINHQSLSFTRHGNPQRKYDSLYQQQREREQEVRWRTLSIPLSKANKTLQKMKMTIEKSEVTFYRIKIRRVSIQKPVTMKLKR